MTRYINGALTDSKIPDAQAGLEAGMTLLSGVREGRLTLEERILDHLESVLKN